MVNSVPLHWLVHCNDHRTGRISWFVKLNYHLLCLKDSTKLDLSGPPGLEVLE